MATANLHWYYHGARGVLEVDELSAELREYSMSHSMGALELNVSNRISIKMKIEWTFFFKYYLPNEKYFPWVTDVICIYNEILFISIYFGFVSTKEAQFQEWKL